MDTPADQQPRPSETPTPRVGLVLGGGGVTGLAYHAAVLAALEHDLGWDPRTADVIVGTSAGSIAGALLRRGVPASDLAALAVGAPTRESSFPVVHAMSERTAMPDMQLTSMLRFRPPGLPLIAGWLRRPWQVDPITTLAAVMGQGRIDMAEHASHHAQAVGQTWPSEPLWVCTVRQGDMRQVVFGRDEARPLDGASPDTDLSAAVLASCAIPGYFRPIEIDGSTYIDGGVRSPTNADVLTRAPLDLAIVISPMSGGTRNRYGIANMIRRYASGKVAEEARRLERRGTAVVVLEPSMEVIDALGSDLMSHDRLGDIVTSAFLGVGDQLRTAGAAGLLDGLGHRDLGRRTRAAS